MDDATIFSQYLSLQKKLYNEETVMDAFDAGIILRMF